ncbi:hypothetical protein QUB60_04445, partial [Microcoleus sp. A2-C5]
MYLSLYLSIWVSIDFLCRDSRFVTKLYTILEINHTYRERLTVNSQQSTVNSQQSTVNSQQSTVNSQQS